jgi:hypothetical protein
MVSKAVYSSDYGAIWGAGGAAPGRCTLGTQSLCHFVEHESGFTNREE